MSHLSRSIFAFSNGGRLPEPPPPERLGDEPRPAGSAWGTLSFMGAMFLIFAVAIILALAIGAR